MISSSEKNQLSKKKAKNKKEYNKRSKQNK